MEHVETYKGIKQQQYNSNTVQYCILNISEYT